MYLILHYSTVACSSGFQQRLHLIRASWMPECFCGPPPPLIEGHEKRGRPQKLNNWFNSYRSFTTGTPSRCMGSYIVVNWFSPSNYTTLFRIYKPTYPTTPLVSSLRKATPNCGKRVQNETKRWSNGWIPTISGNSEEVSMENAWAGKRWRMHAVVGIAQLWVGDGLLLQKPVMRRHPVMFSRWSWLCGWHESS